MVLLSPPTSSISALLMGVIGFIEIQLDDQFFYSVALNRARGQRNGQGARGYEH